MSKSTAPPKTYSDFIQQFPALGEAWRQTRVAEAAGPADEATRRLVKLGVAIGAQREGAVHSAVRKARAAGASDEAKARAYLHTNCSMCHRPGAAPAPALIDLRADVDLRTMDVCAPPLAGDLGIVDARIVAPGDPVRSVLSRRMRSVDHARMPKLGSRVVDAPAADVVDAWIRGVTCP